MESTVQKRRVVITDENLGPIVSIVSIVLLILVILTVSSRLSIRYFSRKQLSLEDGFIFAAAILSAGELVTVLNLDYNGLGSPIQILSAKQVLHFQQYLYSTDVLYVLNLGITKISILIFIHQLTPVDGQRIAILTTTGFITLWTISSFFTLIFQCHSSPHVWQFIENQCINRVSFWISYTILNIVTELVLIILSVVLIWNIKLSKSDKTLVVIPFALRILVIIPAIAQVAYFVPTTKSHDPTLELWTSVLCAQITQTMSIVTACFIQLKQFILSLHSGLLHIDDTSRRKRQDSRSGLGYRTLGDKERSRSNRSGLDANALASVGRNNFVGGRGPYEADLVERSVNAKNTNIPVFTSPWEGIDIERAP